MHVAGADDQLDAALRQPGSHRRVACVAVGVVVQVEHLPATPARRARSSALRLGPVRRHGDDGKAGVEQRLEVGPLAAHEHADHAEATRPTTRPSVGDGTTAR